MLQDCNLSALCMRHLNSFTSTTERPTQLVDVLNATTYFLLHSFVTSSCHIGFAELHYLSKLCTRPLIAAAFATCMELKSYAKMADFVLKNIVVCSKNQTTLPIWNMQC